MDCTTMAADATKPMECSFCGKPQREVTAKLELRAQFDQALAKLIRYRPVIKMGHAVMTDETGEWDAENPGWCNVDQVAELLRNLARVLSEARAAVGDEQAECAP